jgi:hypothetical protein
VLQLVASKKSEDVAPTQVWAKENWAVNRVNTAKAAIRKLKSNSFFIINNLRIDN